MSSMLKCFKVGLFQEGYPRRVEVSLPRTKPFTTTNGGCYFRGLVLLEAVAKELGVDDATRVCLYDLSLDVVVPHRTYDSLLAARLTMTKTSTAQEEDEGEGRRGDGDDDGAAEWEMLLEGGRFLAANAEGDEQSLTLAHLLFQKVIELKEEDHAWVYSLFRHMTTRLALPPVTTRFSAFYRCRGFHSIHHHQASSSSSYLFKSASANRDRLRTWRAATVASSPSSPSSSASSSSSSTETSLIEIMRVLPPPFTLGDVLPLESLAALAGTCRAWWVWIVSHELPSLLRRLTAAFPTNIEMSSASYQWSTTFTVHHRSSSSSSSSSSPPSLSSAESSTFFPLVECPKLLEWMLKRSYDRLPEAIESASALAALVDQRMNEIGCSSIDTERVKSLLRLVLSMASSAATLSWYGPFSREVVVYFFVPTSGMDENEEEEEDYAYEDLQGNEVIWTLSWTK